MKKKEEEKIINVSKILTMLLDIYYVVIHLLFDIMSMLFF